MSHCPALCCFRERVCKAGGNIGRRRGEPVRTVVVVAFACFWSVFCFLLRGFYVPQYRRIIVELGDGPGVRVYVCSSTNKAIEWRKNWYPLSAGWCSNAVPTSSRHSSPSGTIFPSKTIFRAWALRLMMLCVESGNKYDSALWRLASLSEDFYYTVGCSSVPGLWI